MPVPAKQLRCMILSDTHNFQKSAFPNSPLSQDIPKVDVLLHCGDLTQVGGLSAYKKALKMLESFDAELKLVIPGNHDLSLDGEYWRTHLEEDDEPEEHDEAVEIMTGPLAKKAGVTYLNEGVHEFALRDGREFRIFVSPYTPEFCDWAFAYPKNANRWQIPEGVDIVMTHGPPYGILDYAHGKSRGCQSLLKAVEKARPRMHCFGHIHEGYGTQVKTWGESEGQGEHVAKISKSNRLDDVRQVRLGSNKTLMVNAAITDDHNQPMNAPWIVDLPLGR